MKFTALLEKLHIIKPKVEEDEETKRIKKLDKELKKRYRRMALSPNTMGTCFMCDGYLTEEDFARIRKKIAELH